MPTGGEDPAKRFETRRFARRVLVLVLGGLLLAAALWALSQRQTLNLRAAAVAPEVSRHTRAMADKPLDVVFSDSILAIPTFVHINEQGRLAGRAIDLWDCVFKQAGVSARYRLLPNLRSLHELLNGGADFLGSRINLGQGSEAFEGKAYYTDVVVPVFEVLRVRDADRQLLVDELWWRQRVAVIRAEAVNARVAALGGRIDIRAANIQQALKLLVGRRVDVLLHVSNRPGEEPRHFQGHDLSGRTLRQISGHGLLSAAAHRASPDLLARINRGISSCRQLLITRDISALP